MKRGRKNELGLLTSVIVIAVTASIFLVTTPSQALASEVGDGLTDLEVSRTDLNLSKDVLVTDIWENDNSIYFQIKNGGDAVVNHTNVTLFINGYYKEINYVSQELNSTDRFRSYFDYSWECSGVNDTIKVCVDYRDWINESNESNNCRTEIWKCDASPPEFTAGPRATNITDTSATIAWITDEEGSGVVSYGKIAGRYTYEEVDSSSDVHFVDITNLQPSTAYHFKVESTDAYGNTATSKDIIFRTSSQEDDENPQIESIEVPDTCQGVVNVNVSVSDNIGIEKVELHVQQVETSFVTQSEDSSDYYRESTDYSRPYRLPINTSEYNDGPHKLIVNAYDHRGNVHSVEKLINFSNPHDTTPPYVGITAPQEGENITSWSAEIDVEAYDPPGVLPAYALPQHKSVDIVHRVEFYADNELLWVDYPVNKSCSHTLDTKSVGEGEHTIKVIAYDFSYNSASDVVNITVNWPQPEIEYPNLGVTRNVEYMGTSFRVSLNVENNGDGTATDIEVVDRLKGYQAFTMDNPGATVDQITYDHSSRECEIKFSMDSLAPHSNRVIQYYIVPIMFEDEVSYHIGSQTNITYYKSPENEFHVTFQKPATEILISGEYKSVGEATQHAIGGADYLSVTHPGKLFGYYQDDGVNTLLSKTAHLTYVRNGVLGYLKGISQSSNRQQLDDLIEPGNKWAESLNPTFNSPQWGYMLIVGEKEIVPAWNRNDWDWTLVDWVNLSDYYYASTEWGGGPELAVGRIIGNSPDSLLNPIETSIGLYENSAGYGFDRSDALLVSGNGDSYGTMKDTVNKVEDILEKEGVDVEKIHRRNLSILSPFSRDYAKFDGFALGDIGGDSESEIIIADRGDDKVYVYNPSGTLLAQFSRDFTEGDGFAVGDVTGDDKVEILIADRDDKVEIHKCYYLGDGDWDKGQIGVFDVDFGKHDGFAVGDVTGNDKAEILVAKRDGDKIYTYNSDGDELNTFPVISGYGKHEGFAVGDVINDNKEEIIIADMNNHVYTYNGVGNNENSFNLTADVDDKLEFEEGDQLAVGDISPDQEEEILIADVNTNKFYILNANGDGDVAGHNAMSKFWDIGKFDGFALGNAVGSNKKEIFIADRDDKIYYTDLNSSNRLKENFISKAPYEDIIYCFAHGNPGSCGALGTDDMPTSFGNVNPIVYATSCLTGDYEGSDDHGIAESFFDHGAAVYIGATEDSPVGENTEYGKDFFKEWDSYEDIGRAFTDMERDMVINNDDKLWAWMYNIYGDPKLGWSAPSSETQELKATAQSQATEQQPPSSIQVEVPDYEVTTLRGSDYVEIPGGHLLLKENKTRIPYYTVTKTYPDGYRVQDVVLTQRSNLTTTTGLDVPVANTGITSNTSSHSISSSEGWYPEQKYSWKVVENSNDTITLVVKMYPFYYNSRTTDVKFYQGYEFDINYTHSNVSLQDIATDKQVYSQGDGVNISLTLNNEGVTGNVTVESAIKQYSRGEIIDGLELASLRDLRGKALFTTQWNNTSLEPGYYYVESVIKDSEGNVLDREAEDFELTNATVTAEEPSVISVGNISLNKDQTSTTQVVLDQVPSTGLSYANLTVDIANSSVAEFHDISLPNWTALSDNSSLPSSTTWLKVGDLNDNVQANDTGVTLATLTVKALANGTSSLDLTVNSFQNESYDEINNQVDPRSGEVTVGASPPKIAEKTPKDPNGDGVYEDVDGENGVNFGDVTFFFQNFDNSMVENNEQFYDFNRDGAINFGDTVALFNIL